MVAVDLPPEITASFVAEARGYLPAILAGLQAVDDAERLEEAYRFAHTIKSSAAMMGHVDLSQVAELLEGDLEALLLGEAATAGHLAQLTRSVQRIGRLLDAVAGEPVDIEAVVAEEVADRTATGDGLTGAVPGDTPTGPGAGGIPIGAVGDGDVRAGAASPDGVVEQGPAGIAVAAEDVPAGALQAADVAGGLAADGVAREGTRREVEPALPGEPAVEPAAEQGPEPELEEAPAAFNGVAVAPEALSGRLAGDDGSAQPAPAGVSAEVDSEPAVAEQAQPADGRLSVLTATEAVLAVVGDEGESEDGLVATGREEAGATEPRRPQAGAGPVADTRDGEARPGEAGPAGRPEAAALLDELAETVLALGRDLEASNEADLQAHRAAIAAWLARFDGVAGLGVAGALEGDGQSSAGRQPSRPDGGAAVTREVAREDGQAPASAGVVAGALVDTSPARREPDAVDLDPAPDSEEALRRAIEAELRFQIEEEVRAQLSAAGEREEEPALSRGFAARIRSLGPAHSALPAPAPGAPPQADAGVAGLAVEVDPETREVFALEAAEHLERIDADVAGLASEPGSPARLRSLRRSVHTLKGAAAMMGFEPVAALAHSLEDRLDVAASGEAALSPEAYAEVLRDLDRLEEIIKRCVSGAAAPAETSAPAGEAGQDGASAAGVADRAPASEDGRHLPAEAQAEGATGPVAAAGEARSPDAAPAGPITVPVRLELMDEWLRLAGETSVSVAAWPALLAAASGAVVDLRSAVARVRSLTGAIESARREVGVRGPSSGLAAGWAARDLSGALADAAGFDPLELDRYTPADYLLHELAEIAAEALTAERELEAVLESAADLVTVQRHRAAEMQERLLAARLVPLSELDGRLQRAVRGVAVRRQKEVRFSFDGGDAVVDRAMLDPIADALLHLVRNAADHGIEAPEQRERAGKPRAGQVFVVARRDQGEVLVEVSDDGAGLDPERIAAAARAAGIQTEDLSPQGLIDLIFLPGLSTAGQVDEVSGRGVGLDAVRAAIQRVRGTIEVATVPGEGTTFSLRFPITLAQARVVMAEAAGHPVAIPAANVRRVARLSAVETERLGQETFARHAGWPYRLADLAATLGLQEDAPHGDDPLLLFVEAAGQRAALITGAAGGHEEVVVKPVGSHLRALRGVAGATLLQDGRVALLLHLPDLIGLEHAATIAARRYLPVDKDGLAPPRAPAQARPAVGRILRVLVVDDSPTIRKLLVRTLKDLGWETREAKDGLEALENIRVDRPDVVLADIEMPRLDGYRLLEALRANPETAGLPVVMLTSRTAERHRKRAAELGASGYLTKPYRPADVVATLRAICDVGAGAAAEVVA